MLTRISRHLRMRRWALVLLLPYLLLGALGQGLHNHSPFEDNSRLSVGASSAQQVLSEPCGEASSRSHAHCFVCQWHTQSVATLQPAVQLVPRVAVEPYFTESFVSPRSIFAQLLRTRGPPANPFSPD